MTVPEYIKKQPAKQKRLLNKLRRLLKKTFPKADESMHYGAPWYDRKIYLLGLKDSVNIGFCIDGLAKKETATLEGNGKYMQHLKFKEEKDIDEKELVKIAKTVMKKAKPYNKC